MGSSSQSFSGTPLLRAQVKPPCGYAPLALPGVLPTTHLLHAEGWLGMTCGLGPGESWRDLSSNLGPLKRSSTRDFPTRALCEASLCAPKRSFADAEGWQAGRVLEPHVFWVVLVRPREPQSESTFRLFLATSGQGELRRTFISRCWKAKQRAH